MTDQYLKDEGTFQKYFHVLPNMHDDDLDPFQYRLLGHYKRVCGEGGYCNEAVETTAKKCQMSVAKTRSTRKNLKKLGYIKFDERTNGRTVVVTIVDRMEENIQRYTSIKNASPTKNDRSALSDSIPKEEPIKNNQSEEEPDSVNARSHSLASDPTGQKFDEVPIPPKQAEQIQTAQEAQAIKRLNHELAGLVENSADPLPSSAKVSPARPAALSPVSPAKQIERAEREQTKQASKPAKRGGKPKTPAPPEPEADLETKLMQLAIWKVTGLDFRIIKAVRDTARLLRGLNYTADDVANAQQICSRTDWRWTDPKRGNPGRRMTIQDVKDYIGQTKTMTNQFKYSPDMELNQIIRRIRASGDFAAIDPDYAPALPPGAAPAQIEAESVYTKDKYFQRDRRD